MSLRFRPASPADLPAIVALLADDPLGAGREGEDMAPYRAAFDRIAADPATRLVVGDRDGQVVACAQVTFLSGLSRQGMRRALVEGVRVAAGLRGGGIGAALLAECEALARAEGCALIQLTTDRSRLRAHAFYERLGYEQSHLGYKKML